METLAPRRSMAHPVSNGPAVAGALLRGPKLAWAALFLNLMTFLDFPILIPIPGAVGQLITQGALPLAILLALLANPKAVIRPNIFLVLMSLLALVGLLSSLHSEFFAGSVFRGVRLVELVLVLWLLSPWWGRTDMTLLRAHLTCLWTILGSIMVGAVLAPGKAFSYGGRLSGALWPVPPPQVAHYGAILVGCMVVLWFCGAAAGRPTLIAFVVGVAALLASHTRTALLGLIIGLVIAAGSLFLGHLRVRRVSVTVVAVAVTGGLTLGPFIQSWVLRGQSTEEAGQLTGRTKVWTQIAELQRPMLQHVFGSGLSNKSFAGLPIDSNWFATYLDLGWAGIGLDVALLIVVIVMAIFHPPGVRRALALLIVFYCIVASFTETGLGDASPYLLDLTVAASLLVRPVRRTPL